MGSRQGLETAGHPGRGSGQALWGVGGRRCIRWSVCVGAGVGWGRGGGGGCRVRWHAEELQGSMPSSSLGSWWIQGPPNIHYHVRIVCAHGMSTTKRAPCTRAEALAALAPPPLPSPWSLPSSIPTPNHHLVLESPDPHTCTGQMCNVQAGKQHKRSQPSTHASTRARTFIWELRSAFLLRLATCMCMCACAATKRQGCGQVGGKAGGVGGGEGMRIPEAMHAGAVRKWKHARPKSAHSQLPNARFCGSWRPLLCGWKYKYASQPAASPGPRLCLNES